MLMSLVGFVFVRGLDEICVKSVFLRNPLTTPDSVVVIFSRLLSNFFMFLKSLVVKQTPVLLWSKLCIPDWNYLSSKLLIIIKNLKIDFLDRKPARKSKVCWNFLMSCPCNKKLWRITVVGYLNNIINVSIQLGGKKAVYSYISYSFDYDWYWNDHLTGVSYKCAVHTPLCSLLILHRTMAMGTGKRPPAPGQFWPFKLRMV